MRVKRLLKRFGIVLVLALAFLARPAYTHARAAALLLRFTGDGSEPKGFARFGMHEITEEDATIDTPSGPRRARYYVPKDLPDAPGMVVCHGVHHLGIDEPRMQKFARAIASAGVVVLTPELKEIADYHIDPKSIQTIGRAAQKLTARVHRSGVGVLGLSFAGGLSLLAASDPEYAPSIEFVVAVGAHDDLERVARFFVTDEIVDSDNTLVHTHAHDYGAVVLVYMFVDSFFEGRDVPIAREALKSWLWENFDEAKTTAARLSPAGQKKMELVFDHREDVLRPEIERVIKVHEDQMKRVSPHGSLDGLRAQVFLLHGAGDTVIPPSETHWLVRDAPAGAIAQALVSRVIVHVNLEGAPTARERFDLVHLLAGVMDAADREAPARTP
jgi:hypothetical protein